MTHYIRVALLGITVGFYGLNAYRKTEITIGTINLHVIEGDIFNIQADAIVDPANGDLNPKGGLSKTIAQKIGLYGSDKWGEAGKATRLQAGSASTVTRVDNHNKVNFKYIIHAVGPNFNHAGANHRQLTDAYRNALITAKQQHYKTIAFPVISGKKFKGEQTSEAISYTAIKAIIDWMLNSQGANNQSITDIYLVTLAKDRYYDLLVDKIPYEYLHPNDQYKSYAQNQGLTQQSNNQQNSYNTNFSQVQNTQSGLMHQLVNCLNNLKQTLDNLSAILSGR